MLWVCKGKASPHCACARTEKSPVPGHAAVLLPAWVEPMAQAVSPDHHHGLSPLASTATSPQSPGGGWQLRLFDECPQDP